MSSTSKLTLSFPYLTLSSLYLHPISVDEFLGPHPSLTSPRRFSMHKTHPSDHLFLNPNPTFPFPSSSPHPPLPPAIHQPNSLPYETSPFVDLPPQPSSSIVPPKRPHRPPPPLLIHIPPPLPLLLFNPLPFPPPNHPPHHIPLPLSTLPLHPRVHRLFPRLPIPNGHRRRTRLTGDAPPRGAGRGVGGGFGEAGGAGRRCRCGCGCAS